MNEVNSKVKILWLSAFPPRSHAMDAGTFTFTAYYQHISADDRFLVKLISYENHAVDEVLAENEGADMALLSQKHNSPFFRIADLDWKFNPLSSTCGLMPNTVYSLYKQTIRTLFRDGYKPDIVVLDWTQTVLLAPFIKDALPNVPIVATEHDVAFVAFERMAKRATGLDGCFLSARAKRLRKREIEALHCCDRIYPYNRDNDELLASCGIKQEKLSYLIPAYHAMFESDWKGARSKDILFFGALGRMENTLSAEWFIDNVLPGLLQVDSDLRFVVLGSNPPDRLTARQSANVVVPGFVEDIRPYFESSLCFVSPLILGAGIKIKILEAMSSGIPVLTNKIGIEGIPAVPNRDYIHCEGAQDYLQGVKSLLADANRGNELSDNERKLMRREFDTSMSMRVYADRLVELAKH